MQRWQLSIGLAGITLVAAVLAPRLLPVQTAGPVVTVPTVVDTPEVPDVPGVATVAAVPVVETVPRHIDIVLALDTSSSMDDLIDSVRARLWDIVNTIDTEDPDAELRVGLLAFGSPGYGTQTGYVRVVQPLTDDLDAVYSAVWGLHTNGGDEYVGSTIQTAMTTQPWTPAGNPDNRRLLFVAGNEGAMQGPVNAITLARQARTEGVLVSTLYAGAERAGIAEGWGEVAGAGGGKYMAIDATDSARAVVATPYDAELQQLNTTLNGTYLAYGSKGDAKLAELQKNDSAANKMGIGSLVSRAQAKASKKFKTASWDLVEAADKGTVDLDTVDQASLPTELQGLSVTEQKAVVQEKLRARKAAKRRMVDLKQQREAYLAEQAPESGLDSAMKDALSDML